MCDKERVVKEYQSILFKSKSRTSVFMELHTDTIRTQTELCLVPNKSEK